MEKFITYLPLILGLGVILSAQDRVAISGFVDASTALPTESGPNMGFSFDGVEIDLEQVLVEGIADVE